MLNLGYRSDAEIGGGEKMKCRTCGEELIPMHDEGTKETIYVCMNRCKKQLPLGYKTKSFISDLLALILVIMVFGCGMLVNLLVRAKDSIRRC